MKKRILEILSISIMMTFLNVSIFATENVHDDFSILANTRRIEKNVFNETELLEALTGNDENVVINVMSNIELTDGISITGTRNIILRGTSSRNKITFSEKTGYIDADAKHSMFYLMAGANIDMSIQNITLDGAKKGSLFYVGESQAGSKNKITMEEGAILQNGYPHKGMNEATDPSGGAIRLQAGSHFIMNGGQIINNHADRYGGGIYSWATDVIVELNSGKISGNTGRYAGGVVMLGTSALYLHDVEIIDNVGMTNHGDDMFLQDLQLYLGGKTFVKSDIHLNHSNVRIYMNQSLNGEIGFKDPKKVKIEGVDNYVITSEDISHLRTSGVYYIHDNQILWTSDSYNLTLDSNFGNNAETVKRKMPKGEQIFASIGENPFIRDGYIFNGWSKDKNGNDTIYSDKEEITNSDDIILYAQWLSLKESTAPIQLEYSKTQTMKKTKGITYSHWTSSNDAIVTVDDNGNMTANQLGSTTICVDANTKYGGKVSITIDVTVNPMQIIYGPVDKSDPITSLPYLSYVPENGKAPLLSDMLGFYPVKKSEGDLPFEADTDAPKINLVPQTDVEYIYKSEGHTIITDTLPIRPTTKEDSIKVKVRLKNKNYQFCTMGTNWKPGDTITVLVDVYKEGMKEIKMLIDGKEVTMYEEPQHYEYTGEGIVPTDKDLTKLITENDVIKEFTVHFHAVIENTEFVSTHMTGKARELKKEEVKRLAPKEIGVYSFVINGTNEDAYSYVSRRYEIVKGIPKGEPTIEKVNREIKLSEVELRGTMENAAGKEVEGKFAWNSPETRVEQGREYRWTFTPEDTEHYETVVGESVVWEEEKEPEVPEKPEKPEKPDENVDIEQSDKGKSQTVKTKDNTHVIVHLSLFVMSGLLLLAVRKIKNKEKGCA